MTDDKTDVDDAAVLEERLAELLRSAHRNGVTVDGGWEVDGTDGYPDWDVVVTVVERTDDE